jgi:hypothetical protein
LPADQFAEDYVLGTLPETESAAFEDHYFACPVCLGMLEAVQAARMQLQAHPVQFKRAPIAWPYRIVALGAIAATLIAVAFVYQGREHRQQSTQAKTTPSSGSVEQPKSGQPAVIGRSVASLADLTLPTFRTFSLRGPAGDPAYEAGMKAYASQDCPTAEKHLAQVPAASQFGVAARFYTGVCLMHDNNLVEAAATLQKVANAGDSPQQEAALYYLGQIAVAQNDVASGDKWLNQTIALRGDFEKRARMELAKLQTQSSSQ